jgi:hypothetical protein
MGFWLLFVVQLTNLIMMLLSASALASLVIAGTGDDNSDPIAYVEGEME